MCLVGLSLGKPFSESLSLSESTAYSLGKGFGDSASLSESRAMSLASAKTDQGTVTDVAGLALSKSFTDLVQLTDSLGFLDNEGFTSAGTVSDSMAIDFGRILSDPISAADVALIMVSFSRSFGDTAILADSASWSVGKTDSDIIASSDSGVLLNQDYVDNGQYFADDYVGDKRIF